MDHTTQTTSTEIIDQQDMVARVATGEAQPLHAEGVPGPVQIAGQWWAIPVSEQHYRPVTDPEQLAVLDRGFAKLTALRAAAGLAVGDQ